MVLLIAVAAVLFWKRSAEGLLSGEGALSTILLAGLRLLVLPLVATTLACWAIRLLGWLRRE